MKVRTGIKDLNINKIEAMSCICSMHIYFGHRLLFHNVGLTFFHPVLDLSPCFTNIDRGTIITI